MKYIIYTDGSSRGNPGPGGWGIVVKSIKHKAESRHKEVEEDLSRKELGGREENTTNNRMELTAVIKALEHVRADHSGNDADVTVHSDSEYVIKGITQWIDGWKRKNWKNSAKKPVMNKDLWMKLDGVSSGLKIAWKHVRGHVGIEENERCDEIATSFADGEPEKLDLVG